MTDENELSLFRIDLCFRNRLSSDRAEAVAAALEDSVAAVSLHNKEATDGDDWSVSLTVRGKPDMRGICDRILPVADDVEEEKIRVSPIPPTDWLRQVHENFPPVSVGRFFIYGSHYAGPVPAGKIPLNIDAATAFGSGEHETTRGCLMALERLSRERAFENVLDMGCGSGILAVAAAKLWPGARVTAADIDPEAVLVTQRHAKMNGIEKIVAVAGDGCAAPAVKDGAPYDVILANILAEPLVSMAPDFRQLITPQGFCILSGLLGRQEQEVLSAYRRAGFSPAGTIALEDWRALVLKVSGG